MKYLGRDLQTTVPNMRTLEYTQLVTTKTDALLRKLRQLTSQEWGLKPRRMVFIYCKVYVPIICYAPANWPDKITSVNQARLEKRQRQALLTVTGDYSQCRVESLQAIGACMTIDLEIEFWLAKTPKYKVFKTKYHLLYIVKRPLEPRVSNIMGIPSTSLLR